MSEEPAEQQSTPTVDLDAESTQQGDPASEEKPPPRHVPVAELAEERAKRKELQARIDEFETFRSTLTEALGIKSKDNGGDALTQVQEQLAQMQRDNSVLALANEHSITNKDDLDLLRSTADDEARARLAARLAAKSDDTPGTPKPDATQGGKGAPKADPGPGFERLRAAYGSNQ